METVGFIAKHVSGQLSDQKAGKEFIRWPRDLIVEYMREGIKEIQAYRNDAFSHEIEIQLKAGMRQELTPASIAGSTVDFAIDDIVCNKDGSFVTKSDAGLIRAFGAYSTCTPLPVFKNGKVVYNVKSYALEESNNKVFYVSPPVPTGLTPIVKANVQGTAFPIDLTAWNKILPLADKYYNNLIDYMMARAYQRDTESQVAQAQAGRLFTQFYAVMGVKYKYDAARGSGYFEGRIGDGDSRAAIR